MTEPNLPKGGEFQSQWIKEAQQLNGDFERLTVTSIPTDVEARKVRDLELEKLERAHVYPINWSEGEAAKSDMSSKEAIRMCIYKALLNYQLSALKLLRYDARKPDAERLKQEIERAAMASLEAADKGLALCDSTSKSSVDADAETKVWIQTSGAGVDNDLRWYRTAARAVLALYGQVETSKVGEEIQILTRTYPYGSKDWPLKDLAMSMIHARAIVFMGSPQGRALEHQQTIEANELLAGPCCRKGD